MYFRLVRSSGLFIFTLCFLLFSCVTLDTTPETGGSTRQSFLWEAVKGPTRLTLVGTMHIGIREGDMDPELWKSLESADTVIIETDVSKIDPLLLKRFMTLPEGETLSTRLGGDHWLKFLKVVRDSGSPLSNAQLDSLSPLAAGSLLLHIQTQSAKDVAEGEISIDQFIFEKGKSLGKQTRTLETNEEQLTSLEAVFTIPALKEVLDEWDAEADSFNSLREAYRAGNTVALDELLKEIPEDMRLLLLEKRNKEWIRKLPALQGRHSILAVGAAHFAADYGLLKLLEGEGYRIRRVQ